MPLTDTAIRSAKPKEKPYKLFVRSWSLLDGYPYRWAVVAAQISL
jgi:hypothetical protein